MYNNMAENSYFEKKITQESDIPKQTAVSGCLLQMFTSIK